ncbi:MAG TPA: hypothetical protein VIY86_05015, partial [Pirellulaceae bacterium]
MPISFVSRIKPLAIALIGLSAATVWAQPQPVVVVTATSMEKLLEKAKHLADIAGMPQMGDLIQGTISGYANGLDAKRPLGVVLQADDQKFQV